MHLFRESCTFYCKIKVKCLSQTPYVCGLLFCKLRFLNRHQSFVTQTRKELIENNCVTWNEECYVKFHATIDKHSRILKPCLLRISVRKQLNRGLVLKIGYVDVNLSEFCGVGEHNLKFYLKGYHSVGLDNSVLEINVDSKAEKGNVIFKPSVAKTENRVFQPTDETKEINDITHINVCKKPHTGEQDFDILNVQSDPIPCPLIRDKSFHIGHPQDSIYHSWFKCDTLLDEQISNINVRGASSIKATRVDNDQVTDQILSQSFLCLQPVDQAGLQLLISTEGKPILGNTLLINEISQNDTSIRDNRVNTERDNEKCKTIN